MKITRIIFINRAPFEKIDIDFLHEGVNVLIAANGRGKTTILSHIIDAFYEIARSKYQNSFESIENKFYRVSSSVYNLDSNKSSIAFIQFENNGNSIFYLDCRGKIRKEEYNAIDYIHEVIGYDNIHSQLERDGYVKYFSDDKVNFSNLFEKQVVTFFPSYRFEQPGYLNDPYSFDIKFNTDSSFSGYLPNPIEVRSSINGFCNWVMDIILDTEVNSTHTIQNVQGSIRSVTIRPVDGILLNNLNSILKDTLSYKMKDTPIRFGVGQRFLGGNRLSIVKEHDASPVYPNLFNLSSGESALIGMFGEIIRQFDKISPNSSMNDIEGVVLIDEIDKHLHIKLQKEVLPILISKFPKVQFIVSSHSPFFTMGLSDLPKLETRIIDLDNNGMITTPTSNEQYTEVYQMMIDENQRFSNQFYTLKQHLSSIEKPLIITEGKTDIKHIRNAIKHFAANDIDVEFYEIGDNNWGWTELRKMLDQFSRVSNAKRIIGIFDRDDPQAIAYVDGEKSSYKQIGIADSNVFAFCIPLVNDTDYGTAISIEHYYSKSDLTKIDVNGRRLFLGSEFFPTGNSKDGCFRTRIDNIQHKVNVNGIIDKKVYRHDDLEEKTSIAMSKDDFASYIENQDPFAEGFDISKFQSIIAVIRSILSLP